MANFTGGKIEGIDYDVLALEVNTIFSDTSNGSGGPANLVFSTSDIILNTTVPNANAGNTYALSSSISNDNYIVVQVNGLTLRSSNYTVDVANNEITVTIALTAGASIRAYNRYRHIFGWGQEPLSVYPHPTFSDSNIAISRVLEANINNLIDKVNIMTERVGSDVEITRIAKGNKIYPNFSAAKGDINTIASVIDDYVYNNNANWQNEVATTIENVLTEVRSDPWENFLRVVFRWNFASYNDARYFFNSGGECRLNVEMTGDPSDAGYANWSQVVNRMGVIRFNWTTTEQTGNGGLTEDHGFYDLTDQYQTLFTAASPQNPYASDGSVSGEYPTEYATYSEYVNLVVDIQGRYVELSNGIHSVDLRITMDDTAFDDQNTEGTTTFNAGYKVGDTITNNSATFEPTWLPTVSVIDIANGPTDT